MLNIVFKLTVIFAALKAVIGIDDWRYWAIIGPVVFIYSLFKLYTMASQYTAQIKKSSE